MWVWINKFTWNPVVLIVLEQKSYDSLAKDQSPGLIIQNIKPHYKVTSM